MNKKRRSIRLRNYDYSQSGVYFVTICTQNKECLFGAIKNDKMVLNHAGRMVGKWYNELSNKYMDIECDQYVIMPNHIHAIIQNVGTTTDINVGADLCVCPNADLCVCPNTDLCVCPNAEHIKGEHTGSPLPQVIQWFKTMTTNAYIRGVKQNQWPPFPGRLWQRNYYEHIVRNENQLNRIREYIRNNPKKWDLDHENPDVKKQIHA